MGHKYKYTLAPKKGYKIYILSKRLDIKSQERCSYRTLLTNEIFCKVCLYLQRKGPFRLCCRGKDLWYIKKKTRQSCMRLGDVEHWFLYYHNVPIKVVWKSKIRIWSKTVRPIVSYSLFLHQWCFFHSHPSTIYLQIPNPKSSKNPSGRKT